MHMHISRTEHERLYQISEFIAAVYCPSNVAIFLPKLFTRQFGFWVTKREITKNVAY